MQRLLTATVLTLAIVAACAQTGPGPTPSTTAAASPVTCSALAEQLENCVPAACSQRHPLVRSFQIDHRVAGPEGDRCAYTQTVPGDMLMTCRFTAEGRAEMAGLIRQMERGDLSGGTGRESVLTRECEVRDRDGTPLPWG